MNSRRSALRSLVPTALILTALIALFFAAGSLTRAYVLRAVNASEHLGKIREATSRALELQLDEETGIRGYAATGDPRFLDPYTKAKTSLPKALNELQDDLARLDVVEAAPTIARARADSAAWAEQVAVPTLNDPKRGAEKVQRTGKKLMDQFRSDLERIQRDLETRQNLSDDQLRRAVDRITLLVIVAALILSGIAIAYAFEQVQASERVAEKERVAEEERRQRAELQGAYDAERRIAERLQTAFSQRPLPEMAPLRFSASYVPATEETRLGGDWYDVFVLSESRILFTIGDVTGHGIDAAVTMNRARQAFVSAALLDVDPGTLLGRVNADMVADEDRLVTAIAGVADSKSYEFIYAVAGHPPPVLLEPGRAPRFLDCGSLPLGGFNGSHYTSRRVQTVPGATLILYTDGAVEHSHDVLEGEELLLTAIRDLAEHPSVKPAETIHRSIFKGRTIGDDVAILTIDFERVAS